MEKNPRISNDGIEIEKVKEDANMNYEMIAGISGIMLKRIFGIIHYRSACKISDQLSVTP